MTAKLLIRCPHLDTYRYRILMAVYYNDRNQSISKILDEEKIRKIRAVEIFAELLEDDSGAASARSIFLTTIEEASSIKFSSPDDDKLIWKLVAADGTENDISPELKMVIQVRCPLGHDRIDQIKFEFLFDDPDDAPATQLNNLKRFNCTDYANFKTPDDNQFWTVDFLLRGDNRPSGKEEENSKLPNLLTFPHFAPRDEDRKPKGRKSKWIIRFDNLRNVADRQPINNKFGVTLSFEREKANNGEWWGNTDDTALMLYPLNIAPVGVGRGKPDFEIFQSVAAAKLSDAVLQAKTFWVMHVYSVYDDSLINDEKFTPLAAWNRFIAKPHFKSLKTVKDGNPGSIVPYFLQKTYKPDQAKPPRIWTLDYDVTDLQPFINGELKEEQFAFALRSVGIKPNDGVELERFLAIDVELRNFLDQDGNSIKRRFELSDFSNQISSCVSAALGDDGNDSISPIFLVSVQDVAKTENKKQQSRVGALNLHFAEDLNEPNEDFKGKLTADLQGLEDFNFLEFSSSNLIKNLEESIPLRCTPSVEVEVPFILAGLSPGGQDPLPQEIADINERFPDTIVIPLLSSKEESGELPSNKIIPGFIEGLFALVANEKSRKHENQGLALRLEKVKKTEISQKGSKIDFIVIDQHPSLIAKVRAEISFADEVGNWDDTESFWELADEGKSFELILPPQVVGEEFIKDYETFKSSVAGADPQKPFRLRYKFSPPAVFKLLRSVERQNFTEAPWNIRRLLGYIKGKERGAGVEQLEYELLFGLTTTVKNDFVRLAELNARLGNLPAPLREMPPVRIDGFRENAQANPKICDELLVEYARLRRRFTEQRRLLQNRLALLYPFSVAQKERFLTLDSGVSFRFRTTREVVHPIDQTVDSTANTSVPGFLPLEKGGLRGGVDWGFESANIHAEVIESKTSSSGKIIAPSFTALGGSGYQKAGFARDKSTIYSNTFLGRTFFYSLERIGRIGVLWNRAKHVIVYERSVADTEQFDDKDQVWRSIPVVRKVAEYVEILQPERNYPEFGEAPKERGFILGSKFEPEARIPVDSKWGRDIPGGWVVPLFNPAATAEKPTVYLKPNIHLKIATNEETGKAQTWGRITNPEDLYFYTSTNSDDDDNTDDWSAVPEIDYPLENVPTVPSTEAVGGTHVTGAMDATLPDPPHTEGGYAPFTFNLDTNKQTVNLLADRLASPVEAVIENISMVRRKLENFQFSTQSKAIQEVIQITTDSFRSKVENQISTTLQNLADANVGNLPAEIDKLKDLALAEAADAGTKLKDIGDTTLQVFQEAQADFNGKWNTAWQQNAEKVLKGISESGRVEEAREFLFDLKRQINAAEFALNETRMKLQKTLDEIEKFKTDFPNKVNEFENRLRFEIKKIVNDLNIEVEVRKSRAVAAAISEFGRWQKILNDLRRKTENLIPDFWQGIDAKAEELIDKLVEPNLQDLEAWLVEVRASFEKYKLWIEELKQKIKTAFDPIAAKCSEFGLILDHEVSKILELEKKSIDEIKAGIETAIKTAKENIEEEFLSKADEAVQELTDQINNVHGKIDAVADSVHAEIETAAKIARKIAEKLENDLTEETRRAVQKATEAVFGNATKLLAPFEKKLRDEARRLELGGGADLEKARAVGERTLRLVRAYGEAPIAQAMQLNRERLAYYYSEITKEGLNQLKDAVNFTPATVLMNRFGRELENLDLKTLGVRLPSQELVEKFVADNLPKFDLKDILPDFAGLKLEKFFSGVKIPPGVKDAVNVAHGLDKQTGRAWAKCDVVMPLDKPVSLFNFGAVEARLVKAHLEAHTSISANLISPDKIEKIAEGAITADWHLLVLGQIVLTLEKSTLRFDKNGKLKFEMQPASVKLAAALQFVSDLVRSFNPGKKSGLSFELVMQGMLPVGARAVLNLPLPPLQTGAFAVSHIALRARFEAAAPSGKFYVGFGLSLSSKERPFTLTILFLGGGGWLDVLAMYRPFEETNKLQTRLSIGLAAGADFTFDIGVAAGTVYFLVSLYAEFTSGAGSNLKIALRLSMGGEVSILGIVSVNLSLVLEASYESGGTLKCRGELSVSIEICWCFTLEVEQDVEFVLAGGNDSAGRLNSMAAQDELNQVESAVGDYVNSYGE